VLFECGNAAAASEFNIKDLLTRLSPFGSQEWREAQNKEVPPAAPVCSADPTDLRHCVLPSSSHLDSRAQERV